MQNFITDLMNRMTLDEKIGQLNLVIPGNATPSGPTVSENVEEKIKAGLVGGVFFGLDAPNLQETRRSQDLAVKASRLGIPLIFGLDVIHGHKTIWPWPLALSCSWDMELIEKSARLAAKEATADGICWVFSPMVDICRDPRWGRIAEGSGEDPFLGSAAARAMIKGYQGDNLADKETVMACVKHFALYGGAESGRDYNTVDMSPIKMHEYYLPPYKAAVDAGVGSVMTSFNDINGVPATGNKELLNDILRNQWGFDGFVVSDYASINEMMNHGTGDLQEVAAQSITAGTDMDMMGDAYLSTLKKSLDEGRVSMEDIDRACRKILEAKFKLGLFEDPYRYIDEKRQASEILTAEHRAFAREAVAKSCVLLKNENATLPLKKSGTIALVGPLADDQKNMLGMWSFSGDWKESVTVLSGLKNVGGASINILHAKGANYTDDPAMAQRLNFFNKERVQIDTRPPDAMIEEAVKSAIKSDVIVAVVGECQDASGEAASRTDLNIPEEQQRLLKALKATGKPLVIVVMAGRPLTLNWEKENADAILFAWFAGTEAGNGIADLLFGDKNPSAKITSTFPQRVGQLPLYYNHKNTGRPFYGDTPADKFRTGYLDVSNGPLYPFGYGLSYTQFDYSPVRLSTSAPVGDDAVVTASVTITNMGERAGEETVQLYITDPIASISRAVKELKGFKNISLEKGASQEVSFSLTTESLKFFNTKLEKVWEEGEFVVHIGRNSADTQSAPLVWKKKP